MIVRLSRIFLIIITIFISAIYLPQFYWISFEPRIIPPMVFYSPVIQKFMVAHFGKGGFYFQDEDGHKYDRQQSDHLLPLLNYRLLAARGKMPDSLLGRPITLEQVRHNNFSFRITSKDINPPQIPVFPLFESRPARLRLELPDEYFRITDRMEFIDSRTDQICDSLTQLFTNALNKAKFHFPARKIFGNPTTRKPYDVGYFVLDNDWRLFHIKKINGKPFCKKLHIPNNIKISWMNIKELDLREFCGLAITKDNQIFLQMLHPARLQKLPIENYNRKNDQIIFMGNLFYRLITIRSTGHLTSYLTDRSYNLLKTFHKEWPTKNQMLVGKIDTFIFPFELILESSKTYFVNFNFSKYRFNSFYLNIVLVLLSLIFLRRRKNSWHTWIDLVIILFTGIYGLIGILLFEHPSD